MGSMWMRPVLRLTEPRNRTEPSISVPENQEPKKNRNSRFRFGLAPVLGFFGSVLSSRFFVPRATDNTPHASMLYNILALFSSNANFFLHWNLTNLKY